MFGSPAVLPRTAFDRSGTFQPHTKLQASRITEDLLTKAGCEIRTGEGAPLAVTKRENPNLATKF